MDCIFCKIIAGEIPSSKVYEDEKILGFLDINPASKGHSLVLPKEHYEDIFDVPDELLREIISAVKKVAIAVEKTTASDGVNVVQNNKKAAGQLVSHIHFHIIPRFENDEVNFSYAGEKYSEGEMEETRKRIDAIIRMYNATEWIKNKKS